MLPTTVHQSTEITEPVKANTFPGVIIGVVTSMAMFSIILLLLVPLSIAVIVMYDRKLKKVKDRRRAVVITQYGIHRMEATEMLTVGEGTRCGDQMVSVNFIICQYAFAVSMHNVYNITHPSLVPRLSLSQLFTFLATQPVS